MAFLVFGSPGYETSESTDRFAVVLFCIGAVMLKLLMLWRLASLVASRGDGENTSPQVLLPLVGCLAAACAAPFFVSWFEGFAEVGWFFFGLAGLLCVLLVGGTFLEAVKYHWSDERVRPSVGLWVAAIHFTFLAYVALTQGTSRFISLPPATGSPLVLDAFARTLYFAGLTLFLILAWLAVPMGFLLRLKFDFSFWALAFPLDLLCCASMLYHKATVSSPLSNDFSYAAAYATLALASYANATLFLNTLYWLIKRRWLRPAYKWAPLSLNKLTHEAFRVAGRRMALIARSLREAPEEFSQALARRLADEWLEYAIALEWHADQEDRIMFREIDAFNPLATRNAYEQHDALESMERSLSLAATVLHGSNEWGPKENEACKALAGGMEEYVSYMSRHMDWEEENLLALNRRTFNMDIQVRIVRKIWDAYEAMSVEEFRDSGAGGALADGTSLLASNQHGGDGWDEYKLSEFRRRGRYSFPKKHRSMESLFEFPSKFPTGELPLEKRQVWRVVLPYVVRNLPEPMMRTRFVRCWTWALPERAQHIGEMIYRGVEDHEWNAIVVDVPEIIPRGLPGWTRRI
jgi:hypothetical protein